MEAIRSAAAAWPLAAGFAVLAFLDALRAPLGAPVRPCQWAAALLAVLLVALWLRSRGLSRHQALPILGLAVLLVPTYVDHTRLLGSDGIDYYSYLRSLIFDADLDLHNDFKLLGVDENKLNVLPIGAPLLWRPVVGAFHLVRQGLRLAGAYRRPQASSPSTRRWCASRPSEDLTAVFDGAPRQNVEAGQ